MSSFPGPCGRQGDFVPFCLPHQVLPSPRLLGPAPGGAHREGSRRTHRTSIVCGTGKGAGAQCGELPALGGLSGRAAALTIPGVPSAGSGGFARLAEGHSLLPAVLAALKVGASETSSVPTVHSCYFGTPWDPLGWRWTCSC